MTVIPYAATDHEEWDAFMDACYNATFLHSRRFLSYHGSRFEDVSLRIVDPRHRLIGLFPAAVNPSDPKEVISHPGATYGGIVRGRRLQGVDMIACFEDMAREYLARGFERLLYKAIPRLYQVQPAEDDLYALFRLGAGRVRCDLSAAIDLQRWEGPPSRLRRALKNARLHDVTVETPSHRYGEFWGILAARLSSRHNVDPAHSVEELEDLAERFPEDIRLVVGTLGPEVIAGVLLFESAQTVHVQYSASTEFGDRAGALELVIESCILDAKRRQKRYFDLGISDEQGGAVLNAGLYEFKRKFGASGVAHEFYRLEFDAV